MILGIDEANMRHGGGVTHRVELLRAGQPVRHGFEAAIVWSGARVLSRIEGHPSLYKIHERLLDGALPARVCWQQRVLSRLGQNAGRAVLVVPGDSYGGSFRASVTMSQNTLPFEAREARRFGVS